VTLTVADHANCDSESVQHRLYRWGMFADA
jgi:hypothetical protein